jgi:hypothetical protein
LQYDQVLCRQFNLSLVFIIIFHLRRSGWPALSLQPAPQKANTSKRYYAQAQDLGHCWLVPMIDLDDNQESIMCCVQNHGRINGAAYGNQ